MMPLLSSGSLLKQIPAHCTQMARCTILVQVVTLLRTFKFKLKQQKQQQLQQQQQQ